MEQNTNVKHTPLYDYYQENGVKTVDFGGWAMPIQFSSIIQEHIAVRNKVGLFDCSHMGEIFITGEHAETYLNYLLTNDISKMEDNDVQYNLICNENGGTIDDVMLYRFHREKYMLVCNASNTEKVVRWMEKHHSGKVKLDNQTTEIGLIAIQGPLAESVLQNATNTNLHEMKRQHFLNNQVIENIPSILISRTGYTGEDGFELYVPTEHTQKLWEILMVAIQEVGGVPCGLGARDTLRLEAGLPLYGQELTEETSPLTAGVRFAIKLDKDSSFIGKEALQKQEEEGLSKKVVSFITVERGIPRQDYDVFSEEEEWIGKVTSGTQSPTFKKGIGMALINKKNSKRGTTIKIKIRNKFILAEIVKKSFL